MLTRGRTTRLPSRRSSLLTSRRRGGWLRDQRTAQCASAALDRSRRRRSIARRDAEGVEDCEGLVPRCGLGFVADCDICVERSSSVCEGDEAIDEAGWLIEALGGFARHAVVESEGPEASRKPTGSSDRSWRETTASRKPSFSRAPVGNWAQPDVEAPGGKVASVTSSTGSASRGARPAASVTSPPVVSELHGRPSVAGVP
jgi:hypothetical protein